MRSLGGGDEEWKPCFHRVLQRQGEGAGYASLAWCSIKDSRVAQQTWRESAPA